MSDFRLSSDNGVTIDLAKSAFRPGGLLQTDAWEIAWVASEQSLAPPASFLEQWVAGEPFEPTFSYVAHQRMTGQIIAGRDATGMVPIRISEHLDRLEIFTGPELPSWAPRTPHPQRLRHFLAGVDDDGIDDFTEGTTRLRPGERIVFGGGGAERSWHWSPSYRACSTSALIEQLISALRRATPTSDAYTLSGGLDSNVLVGLAGPKATHLWTMSFPEPSSDETDQATDAAQYFGLPIEVFDAENHRSMTERDYFGGSNTQGFGPLFVPNAFTESAFFKHIAQRTTGPIVVGLGGDQALHANPQIAVRYDLLNRHVGSVLRHLVRDPKRTARQMTTTTARLILDRQTQYRTTESPEWLSSSPPRIPISDDWCEARLTDLRSWSWECATRLSELNARAAGREKSAPWTHPAVWRVLLNATPSQLRSGGVSKGLVRNAVVGLVPEDVRSRLKTKGANKFVEGTFLREYDGLREMMGGCDLATVVPEFSLERYLDRFAAWVIHTRSNYPSGPYQPTIPIWRPIAAAWWVQSLD